MSKREDERRSEGYYFINCVRAFLGLDDMPSPKNSGKRKERIHAPDAWGGLSDDHARTPNRGSNG